MQTSADCNGVRERRGGGARNATYEVAEAVKVEGAMPGEGVEVGGDDAEAALGVGVGVGTEEHRSARESIGFVVGFLRLGLAEDGSHPHLISHRRRQELRKVHVQYHKILSSVNMAIN
jgi:hypothetical protein